MTRDNPGQRRKDGDRRWSRYERPLDDVDLTECAGGLGHGVGLPAVAAAMGDDPVTVLRIYGHLTGADDDRIRSVVHQLWTASPNEVEPTADSI